MKRQQSGFTMIELIMVIVILGILAAFALPRFADLGSNARAAAIQGLAGSIKSASAIVHSAWLAEGSTVNSVTVEGANVTTTTNGYALATAAGIEAAIDVDGFTGTAGTGEIVFVPDNYTGTDCSVTYVEADPAADEPEDQVSQVTVDDTCAG
ncbi:pilin [Stutzerimonas xanthomarina]|uniref:pilin n=1 Tax=Stutzerimonas xanthomarina TaxID=271420 RepID=UPI003AA8C95B